MEQLTEAIDSYERWVVQNRPADAVWLTKFNESRPLITASYKVLNEGRFLPYSLRSIYPYVDRIDIVEGATKEAVALHQAAAQGHSLDDTLHIIKDFPDPDKKIRLIQGKFRAREEMQSKLLEICTSKWMLFIDGDEILDGGPDLRQFCLDHQDGQIVHAKPDRFYNFWHDFHHIVYSVSPLGPWAKHGIPHAFLIWRDVPGLNFSAGHTVALDVYGNPVSTAYIDLAHSHYNTRVTSLDGVHIYHFGNAKGKDAMQYKFQQVHPRLLGDAPEDPWISGELGADMVLEEFTDPLPEVLQSHPDAQSVRIAITQSSPVYTFEVLPGAY